MLCTKCDCKVKSLYRVAVAPKLVGDFCEPCINQWFDLRDKIVSDAFREFLPPVKKTK